MASFWPYLGMGVGLRPTHYSYILEHSPSVDWFEIVSENYMDTGGAPRQNLLQIRKNYPMIMHGVSLSIGSTDALDTRYLNKLSSLAHEVEPSLISDHLCWTGVDGKNIHDLLPLPYTEEALYHVVDRVDQVQNALGRPIALENVSSYVTYQESVMTEWDFLSLVSEKSGCGILLDINNIYVSSFNHHFDPLYFIQGIPKEKVAYVHLAGHTDMGDYLFDTHSASIIEPVWKLYHQALKRFGKTSTLVEWDDDIPDFPRLLQEVNKARDVQEVIDEVT